MGAPWTMEQWTAQDAILHSRVRRAPTEVDARRLLVRYGRSILKRYSTSFFIVTRFLPAFKRAQVNLIYAAVRYPDEICDTFPLTSAERSARLSAWRAAYDRGLSCTGVRTSLARGVPPILAGFCQVVRETGIPPEFYHAFLDAMEADVTPRRYRTLDDLIDNYIYGSAVVVGYFLVHVYGTSSPEAMPRALRSARALGIALQLTNFLRDVAEDSGRGRLYLPQSLLDPAALAGPEGPKALQHCVQHLAAVAATGYRDAAADLDAFAPDCRPAIESCIRVYGELNLRLADGHAVPHHRESVPMRRKLQVLPPSKYWRLPMAWMNLEPA